MAEVTAAQVAVGGLIIVAAGGAGYYLGKKKSGSSFLGDLIAMPVDFFKGL